jgi:hypothetical protein
MSKGGVYGSFVLVQFDKGTSKKFPLVKATGEGSVAANKAASTKPPFAYIKSAVAKYFGFKEISKADMLTKMTKTVKTTINGKAETITKFTPSGATGASRSVTVKFTKLVNIGGKQVASVSIAMPSSHTFGDMLKEITEAPNNTDSIAAIVSPAGKSVTYKEIYNPKSKNKNQKALPAGK